MVRRFAPLLILLGLVTTISIVTLSLHGVGREGLEVWIRTTAQTSYGLFLLGFVAPALPRLFPCGWTRELTRQQPALLLAFVFSHLVHATAILCLAHHTGGRSFPPVDPVLIGGMLAYLFVLVLAWQGTAQLLNRPVPGKIVQSVGLYYLALSFLLSYGLRTAESLAYAPLVLLLMAAIALRLIGARMPSPSPSSNTSKETPNEF